MSQYYVPSRTHPANTIATQDRQRRLQQEDDGRLPDLESSIYIFPKLSSSASSSNDLPVSPSPSNSSTSSVPIDAESYHSTFSSFSITPPSLGASRSRNGYADPDIRYNTRRVHSRIGSTTDNDTDDLAEQLWDWSGEPDSTADEVLSRNSSSLWDIVSRTSDDPSSSAQVAAPARHIQGRQHPLISPRQLSEYVRSRTHSRTTTVSLSTNTLRSGVHATDDRDLSTPHPRVRIPLLSFITSLFAVDETTEHLLTHSTTHHGSVLFPGRTLPDTLPPLPDSISDDGGDDDDGDRGSGYVAPFGYRGAVRDISNVHGFHKLLLASDISSDSWNSLRRGFAMVYSRTAPVVPSVSIVTLWELLNQVWVSGERAIKDVCRGTVVE